MCLCVFLNNTRDTVNYYITAPNVFSMEELTLINEINSIFSIYVILIKRKRNLKLFFGLQSVAISIKMVYYVLQVLTN